MSKAGGTTVRACTRGRERARVCVLWRASLGCVCIHVQFWANNDPQNKVTNEFAAPVLARSAIVLDGVL